jgi:hypothetical protein
MAEKKAVRKKRVARVALVALPKQVESWERAARKRNLTLSEFLRLAADAAVAGARAM